MVRVSSDQFFFHFGGVQRRVEHGRHVVFVFYVNHHRRFAVLEVVGSGQYQFVLHNITTMQIHIVEAVHSTVFLFLIAGHGDDEKGCRSSSVGGATLDGEGRGDRPVDLLL